MEHILTVSLSPAFFTLTSSRRGNRPIHVNIHVLSYFFSNLHAVRLSVQSSSEVNSVALRLVGGVSRTLIRYIFHDRGGTVHVVLHALSSTFATIRNFVSRKTDSGSSAQVTVHMFVYRRLNRNLHTRVIIHVVCMHRRVTKFVVFRAPKGVRAFRDTRDL